MTPISLESYGSIASGNCTLLNVAVNDRSVFRIDIGELPKTKIDPSLLSGNKFPHYHRRGCGDGQGIGRHRPWQKSPGNDDNFMDRF